MTNEDTYFYKGTKDMKIDNTSVLIIRAYFRFFISTFPCKKLDFIPNLNFLWVYIKWRHTIWRDTHSERAYIFLLVTSNLNCPNTQVNS